MIHHIPIDKWKALPKSIIQYVLKTEKCLVMENAFRDDMFSTDPYIEKNRVQSLLCLPIQSHGQELGLLYLENRLSTGVFTTERLETLRLLAAQTAVSIENARLYSELEHKVAERTWELQQKNRQIMESIRYASRIQKSFLIRHEAVGAAFPQSFVLFRPREIVSGDFFWVEKQPNRILLAVADCTGQGVPGALMSIICHNMLSQTTEGDEKSTPSQLLETLDARLRAALSHTNNAPTNRDGMDIALCSIDLTEQTLEFAGAKLPVYLVRKNQETYELELIKGSRRSISDHRQRVKIAFNDKKFTFKAGDLLYLGTDGYANQPNPELKKYGSRKLRKLIRDNAHLDMDQQQALFNTELTEFQKGQEQRDDITLIGIRFEDRAV